MKRRPRFSGFLLIHFGLRWKGQPCNCSDAYSIARPRRWQTCTHKVQIDFSSVSEVEDKNIVTINHVLYAPLPTPRINAGNIPGSKANSHQLEQQPNAQYQRNCFISDMTEIDFSVKKTTKLKQRFSRREHRKIWRRKSGSRRIAVAQTPRPLAWVSKMVMWVCSLIAQKLILRRRS